MHHYDKFESEKDIQEFLDSKLVKIDHPKYSLYMPNEKPLVLIEVER